MGRNKVLYDKQQIIDIAVMIVEEEGIEVLSARRIASKLGVSSMTMYNYVSNIDEVKRELMIRGYNELFHNIIQKLALKEKKDRSGVAAFIKIYAEQFYEYGEKHRNLMKFMLGEGYTKFYADAELRLFVNPLQSYYKYSKERDYKLACRICEDMLYSELKKYINGINPLSKEEFLYQVEFCVERVFGCRQ